MPSKNEFWLIPTGENPIVKGEFRYLKEELTACKNGKKGKSFVLFGSAFDATGKQYTGDFRIWKGKICNLDKVGEQIGYDDLVWQRGYIFKLHKVDNHYQMEATELIV